MNSKHPVSGKPLEEDFITVRESLGYIDKTQFIVPISGYMAPLLCRPRGFGKTHTVNILQHFHGVEYRHKYDKLFKVCALG